MVVTPDSKKETIDPIASTDIDGDATVVSDGTIVYKHNGYTDGAENKLLEVVRGLLNK